MESHPGQRNHEERDTRKKRKKKKESATPTNAKRAAEAVTDEGKDTDWPWLRGKSVPRVTRCVFRSIGNCKADKANISGKYGPEK